jgi:hypothetical protein
LGDDMAIIDPPTHMWPGLWMTTSSRLLKLVLVLLLEFQGAESYGTTFSAALTAY